MRHFSRFRIFLFSALLMPVLLMFSACHSTRKSTVQTQTTPNHDSIALRKACQRWLGTPYRYGGFTTEGIDCSGLVCQIYLTLYQQKLPRTSEQLRAVSTPISTAQLTYGDLVFWFLSTKGQPCGHLPGFRPIRTCLLVQRSYHQPIIRNLV
ncbi:MAG: C40 family peptidase [Bacteroidota bacterium]|nr:MAG: C40 family peptidase [Bacteroidota bacterium]